MSDKPKCAICGEPMPEGEEMFKYHGYSGNCPKPPLPRGDTPRIDEMSNDTVPRSRLNAVEVELQTAKDKLKSIQKDANAYIERLSKELDETRENLRLLSEDSDRLRRELDDAKGVIR